MPPYYWLAPAAIGPAAMLATYVFTGGVLRYTLARGMLDVPNQRSSHSVSTPRGGGVAIVVVVLLGVATLWSAGFVPRAVTLALVLGGGLVAAVGWLDDRYGLPAWARMLAHVAAAACAMFALREFPVASVGPARLALGAAGTFLAIVATTWLTNAYNFMDGIDGLAGSEAVLVGTLSGALLAARGSRGLSAIAFLIAGAAAGFLLWNWAPARIFMGDVGSGFLGFAFAVLALASARSGALPLQAWALLLGVFLFDATITLVRRAARGEPWYHAHRSHAYQRLTRAGWTHARTVSAAAILTMLLGALAGAAVMIRLSWRAVTLLSLFVLAIAFVSVERKSPM